jgi:hypothetical protein
VSLFTRLLPSIHPGSCCARRVRQGRAKGGCGVVGTRSRATRDMLCGAWWGNGPQCSSLGAPKGAATLLACALIFSIDCPSIASNVIATHTRARAHTHTHTHLYIYNRSCVRSSNQRLARHSNGRRHCCHGQGEQRPLSLVHQRFACLGSRSAR